jgi:transcriptional regulator with XRE-family HTH domain
MSTTGGTPPHVRFRHARERIGLTEDELAARTGVPSAGIWDIEAFEDDLTSCYSPNDLQRLCGVLGIPAVALFGDAIVEPPVSASDLVQRIRAECTLRNASLAEFEDVVGWRLADCIEPPERLLQGMTIDGMQWLCRELRIDWRRVLLGLSLAQQGQGNGV